MYLKTRMRRGKKVVKIWGGSYRGYCYLELANPNEKVMVEYVSTRNVHGRVLVLFQLLDPEVRIVNCYEEQSDHILQ